MRLASPAFLFLAIGCAPEVPVAAAQSAIIGGTEDSGDPAVVLVEIEATLGGALCSGEVVSPHVVLTAAHCVTDSTSLGKITKLRIFTGTSLGAGGVGATYAVTEFHAHPMWNPARVQDGYDLAIIATKDALPIAPLAINHQALDASNVGQPVRQIGYGLSSGNPTPDTSGTRRQVTNLLGDVLALLLQFNEPGRGTCEGDSGGPALMKLDGTNEVIVGLTSFGVSMDCSPPGFDTRVDLYASSFIDPYLLQFDPPPPPDLAPPPPGADGFPPGAIGATCADQSQCNGGTVCANPGPMGFCTAGCDPAQAGVCPTGTHCGTIDHQSACVRDGHASGCDLQGRAPRPIGFAPWVVVALALGLALRRRARI